MEVESQEVRWEGCKWDVMVKQVFNMVTSSLPPDVTLVTEDGKWLEAHSLVLKASSPTFRSILHKTNVGNSTAANTTIYMPGFVHEQLALVVEFIYMGKTKVAAPLLQEFMGTFNNLDMLSSTSYKLGENITPVEGRKVQMVGKSNETEEGEEAEEGEITEEMEEDLMGCTTSSGESEKYFSNNLMDGRLEEGQKGQIAIESSETEAGEIIKSNESEVQNRPVEDVKDETRIS